MSLTLWFHDFHHNCDTAGFFFMSCFMFLVKLSGSLSDPVNIAGLAHFCEHMLFLGTKKYPKENEYSQFLSEHAGSSNAFTSGEHTNYYFDISHEHLQGALDRSGVNSLISFVRILWLYLFVYSFLKVEAPPWTWRFMIGCLDVKTKASSWALPASTLACAGANQSQLRRRYCSVFWWQDPSFAVFGSHQCRFHPDHRQSDGWGVGGSHS